MDFRTGRIRFPFRRFFRSLLYAEDAFGRRRLKYERRRIRLGIALGVGLAGLVVWAGFAWQESHQNHIGELTEVTWKEDDFDAIEQELETSLHADRQSAVVLPDERISDLPDVSGEAQENIPMPPLVADPEDQVVQAESTSQKNGPNLLVIHSSKDAGKEDAKKDVSPEGKSPPLPSSGGAKLLGVIEDIPENEPTITSPGQKNKRNSLKPNEGPVIVPGQVMD